MSNSTSDSDCNINQHSVNNSENDQLSAEEDMLIPGNLPIEALQSVLNKDAREEDLVKAINQCKELILDCDNISTERKWLVRHLIELRLRMQELKEAESDPHHPRHRATNGVSKKIVRGHHLKLQSLIKSAVNSKYCDHCTGTIWCLVQAWYACEDCGYSCHYKCIPEIFRDCAHMVVTERGNYEFSICPEIGLAAQNYQCFECKNSISLNVKDWSDARRCDYTGRYFCTACHWGSLAIIPARVVHNWDLIPRPVSQASLQLLKITADRPLINLKNLNPRLFQMVQELNLVQRLRLELEGMRKYLSVCRNAIEDHLVWKHLDRLHLIETPELYSLQDLVDTGTGELPSKLHDLIATFAHHIKTTCETCMGRGHICEICSNDSVLFPFDGNAFTCDACSSVYHTNCYSRRRQTCPKCLRIRLKAGNDQSGACLSPAGQNSN